MRWPVLFLIFTAYCLRAAEPPEKLLKGLPKALANCEAGKIQGFGNPALGSAINYVQPGLVVTLYAYNLGYQEIPDGVVGDAVPDALETAIDELKEAGKDGYYSDVVEKEKGTIKVGQGGQVLRARYHLTREKGADAGKRVTSEIDVFGAHNLIFKVRITGEVAHEAAHRKTVEKFLAELFEALKKPAKTP